MPDDARQQVVELSRQVVELHSQGRSRDAAPLARRACELAGEKLGEDDPDYADSLLNLGTI